jgi:hypothetical protein
MKIYEAIDVWRKQSDGTAIRYRCFKVLPEGGYCVQSADYYPAANGDLEKQFIELLLEQEPDKRSGVFATLQEAIMDFDKEFGNEY